MSLWSRIVNTFRSDRLSREIDEEIASHIEEAIEEGQDPAEAREAWLCGGYQVVVVGGGNSAGQAAVFLAGHVRHVLLLLRGDDLYKNMSSYLARRIEQTANIELVFNTTIRRMNGDTHLGSLEMVNSKTGVERTVEAPGVFSFIGAEPRTS